ncbi:RidA family protein [Paraburkholderia tropica]|uniref:Enamine deaminase RidA, house cleaning of reactive enamine intermediates, YjgF/YER057c/UK114 family n=1 Tax=Paraburkholderia tropica TaxID=92647 RepID=A0AAQ1GFS4_9BURK|nr:RidA family protein [Paraburkholderia tropica]RQN39328.1 RidA family protein [Paraburkholderia tropica]SEJ69724.1 Enamine deaminase RidA, house cleaning of reactive enamine intermediates, YjgF/YER057c/UK114 family [Paraburkholderia tropica]
MNTALNTATASPDPLNALTISARVAALGLTLEPAAAPAANYVSFVQDGHLLYISGQIARRDNAVPYAGQLGADVTEADGIEAARLCALGVVAQIAAATGDRLERVARVVKLGVFVASAPGFSRQSVVANGASDLIVDIFGDAGRHARSAVGVAMLPAGSAVEVDAVVALREL